jgi:glycosyltransferase involved in cell wall biosynthesis
MAASTWPELKLSIPDAHAGAPTENVRSSREYSPARIRFITNLASHYRVRTFELLAQRYETDFVFYSDGGEANWLREHGVSAGRFRHTYLPGFSVAGVRVTPRLAPVVWTDRADITIKCLNGKFALPVVLSACVARRRPYIIWTGDWSVVDSPAHRLVARLNNTVCRHADAVVTYGSHVTRYLIDQGVRPGNIFTSRHAVTNSLYGRVVTADEIRSLRSRFEIGDGVKIVLFVGRLVRQKGLEYLLRGFAAAARSENPVLLLVGTGPERQECENLARELGISGRVRFAGYVSPAETVPYYAASDIFVLPSVTWNGWKETWGLVVNEAFNQGVPVVTTAAVGAAAGGLVLDGENGLVTPERDSDAIANALARLLGDAELRRRLGANAKARIAVWDQPYMVDAFCDAVEHVLARRHNGRSSSI